MGDPIDNARKEGSEEVQNEVSVFQGALVEIRNSFSLEIWWDFFLAGGFSFFVCPIQQKFLDVNPFCLVCELCQQARDVKSHQLPH